MNVNNSKLLLFIPAILEHVARNRTCSIGKLRTHIKKHVITEPSRTPGSPSELDPTSLGSKGGGGSGRSGDQWGGCTFCHNSVACLSGNLSQKNPTHFITYIVIRDIIYKCLSFTV